MADSKPDPSLAGRRSAPRPSRDRLPEYCRPPGRFRRVPHQPGRLRFNSRRFSDSRPALSMPPWASQLTGRGSSRPSAYSPGKFMRSAGTSCRTSSPTTPASTTPRSSCSMARSPSSPTRSRPGRRLHLPTSSFRPATAHSCSRPPPRATSRWALVSSTAATPLSIQRSWSITSPQCPSRRACRF